MKLTVLLGAVESGHLDVVRRLLVSDAACSSQLGWTPGRLWKGSSQLGGTPGRQWKGLGSHLLFCWSGAPILDHGSREQRGWILEALTRFLARLPLLASGFAIEIGILECMAF